jgi:hypothetical protein
MKYLLVGEVGSEKSAGAGRFLAGKYVRNFPEYNASFSLYFVVSYGIKENFYRKEMIISM